VTEERIVLSVRIALLVSIELGGIGRCCKELICALNERDNGNEYFIFYPEGVFPVKLKKKFKVVPIKGRSFQKGVLEPLFSWRQFELPQVIKSEKIDILHSLCDPLPLAIVPCKTIITINDLSFTRKIPIGHPSVVSRTFSKWIFASAKIADRIIVPSNFTREDIIKRINVQKDKIDVIPWGVSSLFVGREKLEDLSEFKRDYEIAQKTILCVSEIIPRKNIIRLLMAFNRIKERVPHDLIIVGHEKYPELYKKFYLDVKRIIEKLKIKKRVKVFCDLSDSDLLYMYHGADIFIYPSLFEGFGLPVLEAMSCNVPVICSKSSSLPEIAGNASILVFPYSIDSIANAMLGLIYNQSEKDRLAREGFARAKRFSWVTTADRTLRLYSEVLREKH